MIEIPDTAILISYKTRSGVVVKELRVKAGFTPQEIVTAMVSNSDWWHTAPVYRGGYSDRDSSKL